MKLLKRWWSWFIGLEPRRLYRDLEHNAPGIAYMLRVAETLEKPNRPDIGTGVK